MVFAGRIDPHNRVYVHEKVVRKVVGFLLAVRTFFLLQGQMRLQVLEPV
mgnify:CR=1 FL=1